MPVIPCHGALTSLSEIHPDRVDALRALLATIDADVEGNAIIPFGRMTTLHFARFVILYAQTDLQNRTIPAQLLFATDYDLPEDAHYAELLSVAGNGFRQVYSHCTGCTDSMSDAQLRSHWHRTALPTGAGFSGTPSRMLSEIRAEVQLRDAIETIVQRERATWAGNHASPVQVRRDVAAAIKQDAAFSWVWTTPTASRDNVVRWVTGLLIPLGIAILVVAAFVFILIWRGTPTAIAVAAAIIVAILAMLRLDESRNPQQSDTIDPDIVREHTSREDFVVQNQMTGIVFVQPGLFRQLLLRTVLGLVNLLATYRYTHGKLGEIPSIHFARWVITDHGRRLLFLSNFDGSWESYLGDFIDKAAGGLTLVWSNCWGFPKTRWLLLQGGARDARRFKAYARRSQAITDVWYSAHKRWSIQNITNNAAIRAGLRDPLTDSECAAWCALL